MISVQDITAVIGSVLLVSGAGWKVRNWLRTAHQADIADKLKEQREKLEERQLRIDAERIAREQAHELADALRRIEQLERYQPPRRRRPGDGLDESDDG